MTEYYKCPNCGGEVRPLAAAGRTTRHLAIPNVGIPDEFEIPTCGRCGEEFLNGNVIDRLTPLVEEQYQMRIEELGATLLSDLQHKGIRRSVERQLGLGVSGLAKAPTQAATIAALFLIASAPAESLEALKRWWESGLTIPVAPPATGSHLKDGQFQSDKYPTTPLGCVPLKCTDKSAQDLLWAYAQRRREVDAEFAADLEQALLNAGFLPSDREMDDED